jgi:hypothetical protein
VEGWTQPGDGREWGASEGLSVTTIGEREGRMNKGEKEKRTMKEEE